MNKKLLFIAIVGVVVIIAVIIYFATSSTPDPEEANNTTGNTTTGNTTTGNTTTGNTTTGNTTTGNTTTGNTTTGKTVACVVKSGQDGQAADQAVTLQQAYDMVNSSSLLNFGTHIQMDRLANEGVTWCAYMWMVDGNATATRGPDLLLSGLHFKAGMPSTYVVGSSTEWPGCGVRDRIGIFYINSGTAVSTAGDARYHTFISVDGNKTAAEINSLLPTGYTVATGQLAPGGINTNSLLKHLP